jgi:hypothetical protein
MISKRATISFPSERAATDTAHCSIHYNTNITSKESGFGGLAVSMLASGTQVRGFKPGRSRRIFRAKKSSACLPSEGKSHVAAFRHVKETYNDVGVALLG